MRDERYGRFTISMQIINDKPEVARLLLRDMLVHRAECLDYAQVMEYVASHPEFAVVSRYEVMPEYCCEVNLRCHDNGIVTYDRGPWKVKS